MDYNKPISNKLPEGYSSNGCPLRILVVDDEVVMRKIIMQIVKSAGYTVAGEAVNGLDAVVAYKMHKPDLVIMDVRMPMMDGFSALQQIIELDKDASILMLTSERDKDTVTKFLKAGAKNYITKPVKREALLARIRAVRKMKDK